MALRDKIHTLVKSHGKRDLIDAYQEAAKKTASLLKEQKYEAAVKARDVERELRDQISDALTKILPEVEKEGYSPEMIGYVCQNL